jgi:dihydroflavonol-4-reductase
MKALLTGASGFVGGNIARKLARGGYTVRALIRRAGGCRHLADLDLEYFEGDLLDQESLREAVRGCAVVFHAAALYTFWASDPRLIYRTNVEGTRNLLAACLSAGIQRAVSWFRDNGYVKQSRPALARRARLGRPRRWGRPG